MSTLAAVMCTLCKRSETVETDHTKPEAAISAARWARHFIVDHPTVPGGVSENLVMTAAPGPANGSRDA